MTMPSPAALHHTCFLVRDLEATAQALSDTLGIGPWNVWTIEPAECRVRGRETRFSFRVALATIGGGTFELITPHSGDSVYDEQLASHGEGFHHTCLVYPTMEAVREAKAELVRQGRELIQEASAGDASTSGTSTFRRSVRWSSSGRRTAAPAGGGDRSGGHSCVEWRFRGEPKPGP
jgi:catechol 2,3-dioxygenase-like lactoylglutathione lyase family enzyme